MNCAGLYGRVDAFKTQVRASYAEVPFRVCTVKQSQTLEHCLREMATKRIRHLFVCDAENRPIKTITSLDLLRQALHTPIEA